MKRLAGKSLAIINSSPETLEFLKTWFQDHGMVVHTACASAFRTQTADIDSFIDGAAPDVVIYDVSLPYIENWKFLETQRSDGALLGIPLIVTTPNAGILASVSHAFSPEGVHELLGKPADMERLTTRVADLLTARV